jgi:hypothetical protein
MNLSGLLGDSPLRVLLRLVVLSVVVGAVLAYLNVRPQQVIDWFVDLVEGVWEQGFGFLEGLWQYFLIGAVIVIPVFIVLRLLSLAGRR